MRALCTSGLVLISLACAGGGSPTERACARFAECGLQAYDHCLSESATVPTATLDCLAQADCADIAAGAPSCVGGVGGGGGFGNGAGCASHGVQDCPFMQTCCAPGGGGQQLGTPGRCMDIAVCSFPTGR